MSDVEVGTENVEKSRGSRGEIGTASAGQTVKQLWTASKSGISLKTFARQLLKSGSPEQVQLVKDWRAHKKGSLNEKRSEKNAQRVAAERLATKSAKKATKK
jgi:hypothetical protein